MSDLAIKKCEKLTRENERLLTAMREAVVALEICGPGASKAQILGQAGYAKSQLRAAIRLYQETK